MRTAGVAVAMVGVLMAGCGGGEEEPADSQTTKPPSQTTLEVAFEKCTAKGTPSGQAQKWGPFLSVGDDGGSITVDGASDPTRSYLSAGCVLSESMSRTRRCRCLSRPTR